MLTITPPPRHGNRCDHDPRDPRGLRYAAGHWAIDVALNHVDRLYSARNRGIYTGRRGRRAPQLFGARSEHAEAVRLVAQVLVRHTRLSDLRVVSARHYAGSDARGITIEALGREAGLSVDRVSAAIRTMASLGWLRGVQRRDRDPAGTWTARVKVRWLTYAFFRALGAAVGRAINRARGKSPTHGAAAPTPTAPTAPPSSPPIDPRDTWPPR